MGDKDNKEQQSNGRPIGSKKTTNQSKVPKDRTQSESQSNESNAPGPYITVASLGDIIVWKVNHVKLRAYLGVYLRLLSKGQKDYYGAFKDYLRANGVSNADDFLVSMMLRYFLEKIGDATQTVVDQLMIEAGSLTCFATLDLQNEKIIWPALPAPVAKITTNIVAKKIKERLGVRRGGKTRTPGYDWVDKEKHRQFRERVNHLRPLWSKAISLMDKLDYDYECLNMLQARTDLKALAPDLLTEALRNRKGLKEKGHCIPLKHGPYAYALKQAARELHVTGQYGEEYESDTLKKYCEGRLPQQRKNRNSDH